MFEKNKSHKLFVIYVHCHRELIEQGVDEAGRKFYKIYCSEESEIIYFR